MMDARDSRGRTVSLLCEDLPRLSQLNLPRGSPPKAPSLPHHSSSFSSSTDSRSSPTTSNTPSLSRSDSYDSRTQPSPSPLTPHSHASESLRHLAHPQYSKHPSSIEGLPRPRIASISRNSSSHSQMDWPQSPQGSTFGFPSASSHALYDPSSLHSPPAALPTPTTATLDQQLHLPQQQPQHPQSQLYAPPVNTQKHQKKNSYPCPVSAKYNCNEFFTTSGHAARHAKKHTGKKDAICPECGKAFTRKDNMEQHRRTHAGGRGVTATRKDAADEASASSSSSSKPVPREVTDESKARKARQQQRKARPSSISTAAPAILQLPLTPSAPSTATTTTLAPTAELELLDPALRADTAAMFPANDFAASYPYPSTQARQQDFHAPQAPMRRPSLSRSSRPYYHDSRVSPPGRPAHAPMYPNPDPLSPSLAPALDALALAASRQ